MKVTEYILSALRDQGVTHVFSHLGGLNDAFMSPLTETSG
jgi:thiamine pyrophosphate-dependent acetolactate synthase large subunit-like protein